MNIKMLAAVAALGVVGAAQAQSTYPYNIAVRGGLVFPIEDRFSDIGGSLLGLGVDYTLPRSLVKGGETYLSLDYISQTLGGEDRVWPIAINQKVYQSGGEFGKRTYAFVGLGGVIVDAQGADGTAFLLRGGLGKELGNNIFGEATLTLADKTDGFRANGLGLYIGYRW